MRIGSLLIAGSLIVALVAPWRTAQGQDYDAEESDFEVPPNSLAYEDSGTLEAISPAALRIQDSKNETWMISLDPHTKIRIEGEAQPDFLRPGEYVHFPAEFDKRGRMKGPIETIEVFSPHGKKDLGLFPDGDGSAAARPVRTPTAGKYDVRAKLVSFHGSDLVVMAGPAKLAGTVGDDLKVTLALDDPTFAQAGDTVKVKAWYYDRFKPNPLFNRPGEAKAQEVTITLAKPLAGTGKKPRQAGKPARSTSKSKLSK